MKHNVNELKVWLKAIDLVTGVYKATASFPLEERFGLTFQIRKSAVSMPSNIAEGAGRNTNKDFCNFLGISNGSAYELMTQLIVSQNLGFLTAEQVAPLLQKIDEIQKMTHALQGKLTREG